MHEETSQSGGEKASRRDVQRSVVKKWFERARSADWRETQARKIKSVKI